MLRPLSLILCLGASLIAVSAIANDRLVAPPAPEGSGLQRTNSVRVASAEAPTVESYSGSQCYDGCDSSGCYGRGFCHPCAHHGFGICHHSWCKCCRFLHSTCDMYPHYPYFPEHHGYYYFRPYNFMHIFRHTEEAITIQGSPWHPYSIAIFDTIPIPVGPDVLEEIGKEEYMLRPLHQTLPKLEDLLNGEG